MLRPGSLIRATIRTDAVDDVEDVRVVLVEHHFVLIGLSIVVKVHRVEIDVEGSVRRSARCGSEDTASICPRSATAQTCIGPLVALIREDGDAPLRIWQRKTTMGVWSSKRRGEVHTAIGAHGYTGESLPIKGDIKRQRNRRSAIVAMIARVVGTGHDAVTSRGRGGIVTRRRCRGWCGRWCGCVCWCGRRSRAGSGRWASRGGWRGRASERRLDCHHGG